MKKYNVQNYVRWKKEVEKLTKKLEGKQWHECTRDELIGKFLPLVENLARKFSTTQQASGVMSINDLIQEGSKGLTRAVDRLDKSTLEKSDDQEKTLKSFLSKRIKGAIRRGLNINRGSIRIPEHKLNEIQRTFGRDKKAVALFFNSIFLSIDEGPRNEDNMVYQIPDETEPYNMTLLNIYLNSLLKLHLNDKEYQVLRLSYGLDCDKHSATDIAKKIGIEGTSSYVRVSQLKKQAVDKLIENVDHSQVLDFL